VQTGATCTLLSDWSEISGRDDASKEQQAFWRALDERVEENDLALKERLSAIGLIKRFFPYSADKSVGWRFPDRLIHLPSTQAMAVIPWLLHLEKKNVAQEVDNYLQALKKRFKIIDSSQSFPLQWETEHVQQLAQTQSRFLLSYSLETALSESKGSDELKEEIRNAFKSLCVKAGASPVPYYAIIMMDGDRLGETLQKADDPALISQALSQFTDGIQDLVEKNWGVTIYAGGDDVMVMLPMQKALACAKQLHEDYENAFLRNRLHATSSTAVVFAHCQAPLPNVLNFARHLLEDEAKERCNRNSLAIGVYKRIGADIVWSAPWDTNGKEDSVIQDLLYLLGEEEKKKTDDGKEDQNRSLVLKEILSNQFIMKFIELEKFPYYRDDVKKRKALMKDFIVAELERVVGKKSSYDLNQKIAQSMLQLCFKSKRDLAGKIQRANGEYSSTGAQLIKFFREQGGVPS
jgi:CRISPR-associated protein Cmr2